VKGGWLLVGTAGQGRAGTRARNGHCTSPGPAPPLHHPCGMEVPVVSSTAQHNPTQPTSPTTEPARPPPTPSHLGHLHAAVRGQQVAGVALEVVEGAIGGLVDPRGARLELALGGGGYLQQGKAKHSVGAVAGVQGQ